MKKTACFVFSAVALMLTQFPPAAYGADWLSQIHPYISVKGEYSDNLNLTPDDQKRDFYTTVSPGVRFNNMTEKSGVDLNASAGYVFYSEYNDFNHVNANVNLDSKYLTRSGVNFYLRNAYTRSDSPREREFFTTTTDNKFLLARETQRAVYWRNVVEPMVEYQFGPESRIGVRYRNNVYRNEGPVNVNSIENYVNPFVTYWLNRQHGISLDYGYTNGFFENSPDLNGHKATGAYMFRFTPKATASLHGAYTRKIFTEELLDYEIYETALGLAYQFSPSFTISGQAGYYWQEREFGENTNGATFKGDIAYQEERTTFRVSVQGGYTEDLFTSQNLGFRKYYRATGSINHFLHQRVSIGCLGSAERTEIDPERVDTIWGGGANIAFIPFKWMTLSAEYMYRQQNSDLEINEYKENRGMLILTLTY